MNLNFHSKAAKRIVLVSLAISLAIQLHLAISIVVVINEASAKMLELVTAAHTQSTGFETRR